MKLTNTTKPGRLNLRLMPVSLMILFSGMITMESRADIWTDSVAIHFGQGKVDLDTLHTGNAASLSVFRDKLHRLRREFPEADLKGITVVGGASPEGSVAVNNTLSEKRAQQIFGYLAVKEGIPSDMTKYLFIGRDWKGLRHLMEADRSMPGREETLKILDSIISGVVSEESGLRSLKALRKGRVYQ